MCANLRNKRRCGGLPLRPFDLVIVAAGGTRLGQRVEKNDPYMLTYMLWIGLFAKDDFRQVELAGGRIGWDSDRKAGGGLYSGSGARGLSDYNRALPVSREFGRHGRTAAGGHFEDRRSQDVIACARLTLAQMCYLLSFALPKNK